MFCLPGLVKDTVLFIRKRCLGHGTPHILTICTGHLRILRSKCYQRTRQLWNRGSCIPSESANEIGPPRKSNATLVHYDLNPRNVAIVEGGKPKINDFNVAEFLTWDTRHNTTCGCTGRFHAITALMRFYETILGRYILKIDGDKSCVNAMSSNESVNSEAIAIMDKLTRDPYQASKRTSQLLLNEEHSPGKVISTDGIESSTRRELMSRMFSTCLWANVIPFLAELTVQQGVLFYGYGAYYIEKKRKKKEMQNRLRRESKENGSVEEDGECIDESAYALSMLLRSSHLTIARSMSWIAASVGGALGAIVWPGWGTVFGIQFGDTIIGSLTN